MALTLDQIDAKIEKLQEQREKIMDKMFPIDHIPEGFIDALEEEVSGGHDDGPSLYNQKTGRLEDVAFIREQWDSRVWIDDADKEDIEQMEHEWGEDNLYGKPWKKAKSKGVKLI